jgi:hypothetical protein
MAKHGWEKLLTDVPNHRGAGRFPIMAYSEFMPPPRIGWRPCASDFPAPRSPGNPWAWQVTEREEDFELQPGLQLIARQVLHALRHLDREQPAQGISAAKLAGNSYWPKELAELSGAISHERYVILMPLALSRTQDDKGRVRWTFFGSSEQGPDRAFWRSFYNGPGQEKPPEYAADWIRRLLRAAYDETPERLADLRGAGFRILPGSGESVCPLWRQDPLPSWTKPFLAGGRESVRGIKYLLTFRPFGSLPRDIRAAYLAGDLHLLPFPGSLLFWGAPPFLKLQRALRLAVQVPLLNVCDRHEALRGLRIPQSGWLHEPRADLPEPDLTRGKLRNTYQRTYRGARLERYQDELAVTGHEDRMAHVLFSTNPQDVGLYNKPMARNAQIWTEQYELLLDGPQAERADLARAATALNAGGHFGYRFFFPPMQVGKHEVFWHRPLVAFVDHRSGEARLLDDAPTGYLTAYSIDRPDLARPIEFWPEVQQRPVYVALALAYRQSYEHHDHQTALNVFRLLEVSRFLGGRCLPYDCARQILNIPNHQTLDQWLAQLAEWPPSGPLLHSAVRQIITPRGDPALRRALEPLTFQHTANRAFEVAYWQTIARLATGRFRNKDNADCVRDPATLGLLSHKHRDLEALGDYLLAYYRKLIVRHGLRGQALAGDLPFQWRTDFDFPWMDGWRASQSEPGRERNLLVIIPGRNRGRAVIMADHYDTAYMEDLYYRERGGKLARVAAAGADDNHSATAALMLAAPVFLRMSRAGQLDCDIWLVHLTGEEFPADCLGARHLAQWLVEGTLRMRAPGQKAVDLSKVKVAGVYVLDMIAHNRDRDRNVFQISPGLSGMSFWLAYQAHTANMIWNTAAEQWNHRPERRRRGQGQRSPDGRTTPAIARFPRLHGEIRPPRDPRSSLFNTDAQIFSDVGIPVVLFMEHYDINRSGYHDTHDNMSNIDLDYGAAVAAIAIESVARAATRTPSGTR